LTLSKTSDTLNAGDSETMSITINKQADSLDYGPYESIVTFLNNSSSQGPMTRTVTLTINTPVIKGDINGDDSVTPSDAQMAFNYYMQSVLATSHPEADVNHDGQITPGDAQEIFCHYMDPSRQWP
jgi:hypothetical protein